jgi:hypothetical protein
MSGYKYPTMHPHVNLKGAGMKDLTGDDVALLARCEGSALLLPLAACV